VDQSTTGTRGGGPPTTDGEGGDDVSRDVPDDDVAEALDDADDDALTETDVDPTGNVVRNDAVEAAEDAAAQQQGPGRG
jgi:hypothetical protein